MADILTNIFAPNYDMLDNMFDDMNIDNNEQVDNNDEFNGDDLDFEYNNEEVFNVADYTLENYNGIHDMNDVDDFASLHDEHEDHEQEEDQNQEDDQEEDQEEQEDNNECNEDCDDCLEVLRKQEERRQSNTTKVNGVSFSSDDIVFLVGQLRILSEQNVKYSEEVRAFQEKTTKLHQRIFDLFTENQNLKQENATIRDNLGALSCVHSLLCEQNKELYDKTVTLENKSSALENFVSSMSNCFDIYNNK